MSFQGSMRLPGGRAAEWDPWMRQGEVGRVGSNQVAPEAPSSPEHAQFLAVCVTGLGALEPTPTPSMSMVPSPQVRMAILRIIGQLALSGYQERIKGWGLKYVSVQLTLSTYKLVSGRDTQITEQLDLEMVSTVLRGECHSAYLCWNLHICSQHEFIDTQ